MTAYPLIPFRFANVTADEACWPVQGGIPHLRFTRSQVGRLFNPDTKDTQKYIDKLFERIPPLKSLGIPVTVTGKTGQEFETLTYDLDEVYQIAIESDMPRAKQFLRGYPAFRNALLSGRIQPPPMEIQHVLLLPATYRRSAEIKRIAMAAGRSLAHTYRLLKKNNGGINLPTSKGLPKKTRADKGAYKDTDDFKSVEFVRCQMPGLSKKEIARATGVPYSKVTRWTRAA